MKYGSHAAKMIDTKCIFLDENNPRHEPFESQSEVIEFLCKGEYVLELAKDISKHGLNPIELFALIPKIVRGKTKKYIVAEGNRRFCALLLLNDPELAPTKKRKEFQKLADNWQAIPKVFSMIFSGRDEVKLWLDRIHGGVQGGIGRKPWDAEQKARNSGNKKNQLAQEVLDYAQDKGFITTEERKGKLSVAQRFLANSLMRESLGLNTNNIEDISFFRPKKEFHLLLDQFVSDIASKEINTRANKNEIIEYSRNLQGLEGVTGKTTSPSSLGNSRASSSKPGSLARPKMPSRPKKLEYNDDTCELLKSINSYKLEKLYYSLCSIDLESHTPLLSVCVWSFCETLTARDGKSSDTDFLSYLSKAKLTSLGFDKGRGLTAIREVIKQVKEYGNTTKHDHTSAFFNGEQLANDFTALKPLIDAIANSILQKARR